MHNWNKIGVDPLKPRRPDCAEGCGRAGPLPVWGHQAGQSFGQTHMGEAGSNPSTVPVTHFLVLLAAADQLESLSQKTPMLNRHKFQIILVSVKLLNNEYKSPVLSHLLCCY